MASYSALLLEVVNGNLKNLVMDKPSGDCKTIPAPPPTTLDEPLVSSVHNVSPTS